MNKKIKFLIADITYIGGIERVNTIIANKFYNSGFDIEIISLYKSNEYINYDIDKNISIKYINKKPYTGKPGSISRLVRHLKSSFSLCKYLYKCKDYTLIVNSFPMAFLAFPYVLSKKNSIVVEHVYSHYYRSSIRLLRSLIYKKYKTIVALTDNDINFYKKKHSNVVKIENPSSFKDSRTTDLSQKKIIAVGRLEYQKGFDLLIDSFNALPYDLKKDWSIDIYGDGSCKKELDSKIKNLSLEKNILLKGSVNNIQDIYPNYSFFVFPSRFEGFGMVLVEAMECGLPCISYDCPTGPREILKNGDYGFLVNNGDIHSFSKKMEIFMNNPDSLHKYSLLSKERATDFDINKIFKKWLNILS